MGFVVTHSTVRIGPLDIVCTGSPAEGAPRGITGWTFAASDACPGALDGLAVHQVAPAQSSDAAVQFAHPNGVSAVDHLVVATPDLDRTTNVFQRAGLDCRRERERTYDDNPKSTMRQAFFWFGDATRSDQRILCEVVGPKVVDPKKTDRPASLFGLALTSDDLDATAAFMVETLKPPINAVQPGRRIATVRSSAGSSVPIAIMSPHINPSRLGEQS